MKRILLFVLTNLAILIVLSLVTRLLGVDRWLTANGLNWGALMVFSVVLGFGGSLISLAICKWIAIHTYSIHVIAEPGNSTEEWLVGKVAELAKKAGVAMPTVGIYESEEVNAFATGPTRNNAIVAVSTGLLNQMQDREVEGVLAHEVAHVANGDMVTLALLQGVLNTFVVFLSRVAGFLLDQFLRRGDDHRGGLGMGYYVGYFVFEIVFGIAATLVVMAYSRHREFRADAMGASLEGKPAMIGALKRLKRVMEGDGFIDDRSATVSAFKISNKPGRWFASHPPLEDRIAALERLP